MSGRRPDYRINAMNMESGESDNIGVAWIDERGFISLKFNRFVVVPIGKEYTINMFPPDYRSAERVTRDDSDEIPF